MLQEEYKLSVSAGEEAFLQGVEMLLAQKKQESAERGDSAIYIHLICTAVSPPLALAMADIWQRIWPEAVITGLSETIFDTEGKVRPRFGLTLPIWHARGCSFLYIKAVRETIARLVWNWAGKWPVSPGPRLPLCIPQGCPISCIS